MPSSRWRTRSSTQHSGYDLFGIVRAALKNFTAGHVRQGASTITQQLARNTFSLKERTFRRKLLEIFLARRIEEQLRQTEDHGAVSEPDLFRRRTLWRGSGRARLLRQTGARNDADGMRHARGLDQEPEPALALDRQGRLARRAQRGPRPHARPGIHHAREMHGGAGRRHRHRQPAKRAGADLCGRVHPAAGDRGGRLGSRDE